MTERDGVGTLPAALELWEAGFNVVPAPKGGKRPTGSWKRWQTERQTERDVRELFGDADCNIFLVTGAGDLPVVVLDCDNGEAVRWWRERLGAGLTAAVRVRTGGGGRHYYFRLADGLDVRNCSSQEGAPEKWDVRGVGGGVIAPPSTHESGSKYRWAPGHGPRSTPEVPVELLRALPHPANDRAGADGTGWDKIDVDRVFEGVEAGGRDEAAFRYARSLRARSVREAEALALMETAWRGMEQPPGDEFTLETALEKVRRTYREVPPGRSPEFETTSRGQALHVASLGTLLAEEREPARGLWGRWVVRGEMSSIAARGGMGKTTFTRNLMARSAAGGAFLGLEFDGPLSWVYFTREGASLYWLEKIGKVVEALGLDADALERIHVVERGGDCGVRLTHRAGVDSVRAVLDELKSGPGADVVAFDPFTRFKDGSENKDDDMARAVDAILEVQREFDVAGWVPHHASQQGAGLDAWRGSTVLEGGFSTGLLLTAPTPATRKLSPEKARYSALPDDLRARHLDFDQRTEVYSERPEGEVLPTRGRLLAELSDGQWHRVTDIAKAFEISRQSLMEHVGRLLGERRIERQAGERGAVEIRLAPIQTALEEAS